MKNIIKDNYLIIVLMLLATALRLWKLGEIPPGLTSDEASLGYNAYSIFKTGRDEYGELLPIVFKSFGDYKPGLYVYLTIPFIAVMGLNEWAVRLPSAIAGIVAVFLVYMFVLRLFKKDQHKTPHINHHTIAIVAAAMIAVSPWHLQFSRGAWEVNVALTLTLAGIYYFFTALYNNKYVILSAFFFALTLVTYQGAKLSTLIILTLLALVYFNKVKRFNLKAIIISIVVALVIALPALTSFSKGQTGRLSVFSVFSYPRSEEYLNDFLRQDKEKVGDFKYYLYHTEGLNFLRGVMGRYFNHFSTRFLFFEGDYSNPRHSPPNHGMLFIPDIIFLITGLIVILKDLKRPSLFILLWFLLSPLPAVLSRDQVHAVRSLNFIIPAVVIMSIGFIYLLKVAKNNCNKILAGVVYFILFLVYLVSFIYYFDSYYVHLPVHSAKLWHFGNKEVALELLKKEYRDKKVLYPQSYQQPYVYFLFYGVKSGRPLAAPGEVKNLFSFKESTSGDVGLVEKIGNISFLPITWPVGIAKAGDVVVMQGEIVNYDMIGEDFKIISDIRYPNSKATAYWILEKLSN